MWSSVADTTVTYESDSLSPPPHLELLNVLRRWCAETLGDAAEPIAEMRAQQRHQPRHTRILALIETAAETEQPDWCPAESGCTFSVNPRAG